MRGMNRRGLRLELVAGLGIALATASAYAAAGVATTTTLTAGAQSGCAQALTVAVNANGQPIAGTVNILDQFNGASVTLASQVVTASGTAATSVSLVEGTHSLTAVYVANGSYLSSTSATAVSVTVASPCQYTVSVVPTTATVTAGASSQIAVSVTPSLEYTNSVSGPQFVTLSCSGLPDQATCTFTPASVEIQPSSTTVLTSTMVIGTQKASSTASNPVPSRGTSPIALAILFPGALGLAGLAWGGRRRRWLSRISLMALVGVVTLLSTTACNPRYDYLNHGPDPNPATPAGTYTVTVTGQSQNGITAITQNTTMALTVQ